MTEPIRFALVGKSGSGKSRAAAFLSKRFGVPHLKTGALCREISRLLFNNEDKASTQRLDDALTGLDPSIFLRATLRPMSDSDSFVVDALRFTEDLTLARSRGCKVLRIVAPVDLRERRLAARGQVFNLAVDGSHRSETELDDAIVDFEIFNDAGFEALEGALSRIVAEV